MRKRPDAIAKINGSHLYPNLRGIVEFLQIKEGVLVSACISGLPTSDDICRNPVFAMHLHSGLSCTENETDPFADAATHYNPENCLHPYHAGDMPPLFGASGLAISMFLTDRFSVEEIIRKSVIIHSGFDDFSSQPAGNSGEKIACGVITKV